MIITLCGSARFEPWFHAWNEALSLAGHCVFGLAAYPSQHDGTKEWYTPQQKEIIDAVHLGKIATSHAVLVLNVFAYIGESTLKEIEYALSKGKETYFLESWGAGYGIGTGHFAHVQAARDRFGVPKDYGSPIATHGGRWPHALLPDSGQVRRDIVTRLQRVLEPIAGGWGFQ